jgi:biopolymer transport protein ExbD
VNFRRDIEEEDEGFQLAPMIDIVFQLLIFFVVTSSLQQVERELGVNVPTATQGKVPKHARPPYYLNIRRDGSYVVSHRVMTHEQLKGWLASLGEAYASAPPPIVIRADREVASRFLVKAIDACVGAGISNFAIANLEESSAAGK